MREAGVGGKSFDTNSESRVADAVRDYGAKVTVVVHFENPQEVVIPKRGIFARGICYFAAGGKQIPR